MCHFRVDSTSRVRTSWEWDCDTLCGLRALGTAAMGTPHPDHPRPVAPTVTTFPRGGDSCVPVTPHWTCSTLQHQHSHGHHCHWVCGRQGAWGTSGALGACATYIPVTPLVPHPKEILVPVGALSYSQAVG